MAVKMLMGDKLAQFEAALAANGLNMSEEFETGFAGLQNIKASALNDARSEVAEELAGMQTALESAEANVKEYEAQAMEAEQKAETMRAELLKAERETPTIPVASGEPVDHRSTWEAMGEKTQEERKAKAEYFAKYLSKKES